MASNDQWPPVSSASKGTPKANGNKRNIKDSQQYVLSTVNEMFGSALEPEVILQVVQNCNWDLQPSIEGLITLTETVEPSWNDVSENEKIQDQPTERLTSAIEDFQRGPLSGESQESSVGPSDADYQPALLAKSEKPKRGTVRNRMGSFCGNIAKLKSCGTNNTCNNETSSVRETFSVADSDFFFDDMHHYGASDGKIFREASSNLMNIGDLPDVTKPPMSRGIYPPAGDRTSMISANWVKHSQKNSCGSSPVDSNRIEKFLDTKQDAEDKQFDNKAELKVASLDSKSNMRKNESESLCGLKVQYRLSGMENSSDDDADVVIEDESSDYKINPASSMSISVSQFLSPPTETPPQRTQPEIHMINTPSQPQTPQRNVYDATLNRIKSAIHRGSKIMILLRGLPGSGKTTLARSIVATTIGGNSAAYVFNADDFFVTLGRGVYQFDPTRLQEAHNSNQKRVWNALKEGRSPVIVDNTNIEAWEMRPYAAMAVENGYIVEILEPNTPWAQNVNELAKKNIHNVPKSKIRDRYQRYERGLTGKKLLDKFSITYSNENIPPQLRKVPPIPADIEPEKAAPTIADFKSNWGSSDENDFVLTTRDIESMQNIDESHCSIGLISERVSVADDSSNSLNNSEKASNHDDNKVDGCYEDSQDSDESFEMLDDGASLHHSDVGNALDSKEDSQLDNSTPTPKEFAAEYVAGTMYSSPNGSQQFLGAIGSERKGSLSIAASIGNPNDQKPDTIGHEKSDNVLSQCWDCTLLVSGYEIHSKHNTDEPNREPNRELVSPTTIPQVPTDEAANRLDSRDKVKADIARNPESESENCEQLIETNKGFVDDMKDDVQPVTQDKISLEAELGIKSDNKVDGEIAPMDHMGENIDGNSALLCGALNTGDRVDKSSEEISENFTVIVEEPIVSSAFGTFSNEIVVMPKQQEDASTWDTAVRSEDYKDDDKDVDDTGKDVENTVDFSGTPDEGESHSSRDFHDITLSPDLNGTNIYPDLSNNPFRQEMLESQLTDKKSEDSQFVNDNMNSISWKPLPFPIDPKTPFALAPPLELKSVSKRDASTNTTYYDFNVSYVGGTSEPGYCVLTAMSRCINQGTSTVAKIEFPPLKLMLDKSSMTNEENILDTEPNSNLDRVKDSDDRIEELSALFPHIPIEYLTAFYVQQCNRNFDWAVDVLLEDGDNGSTLEGLEINRPTVENDAAIRGPGGENDNRWKMKDQRWKQRLHSSSPRRRRNKNKDFLSLSTDFVYQRSGQSAAFSNFSEDISPPKDLDDDDAIFRQFCDDAAFATCLPVESGEIVGTSLEEDSKDEIELNFGQEFINQLEKTFGNPDFVFPDEFTPAIRIKKSMAEELHALWIQSIYRQLNDRHAQLDEMIAKDEAIAIALDREEMIEPLKETVVPNFSQIMDMEMALAKYQNDLKEKTARETPNDMASRLSRQMLCELLPDIDPQTVSDIFTAHNGNFNETRETIETSIGRKIRKSDSLKKQQTLLDRVNEESKNRGIAQNSETTMLPPKFTKTDMYMAPEKLEKLSSKSALAKGQEARKEAQDQFSLRIDYFNKAAEACRRGNRGVAAYYSQMAKLHSENMRAAHNEAAKAFMSAQICDNDEDNTLDLHHLFVPEALEALDTFLDQQSRKLGKSNKRSAIVYIITGRGARSNNGLSKLKPAVSKNLLSRNIRFTESNPGCLKVTLSKKNSTVD